MFFRTVTVALVIVTSAFLATGICQTKTVDEKPVLEIPLPSHDAGSHWEGETVAHSFEVKNSGTAELKILKVKPG